MQIMIILFLLHCLHDRRVETACTRQHCHFLNLVTHPRFSHSDNEINVHLRQIKRRIQRSYIFNEFNKAKKDTRCEDCNKNGVGRTPEFRTPNLKITVNITGAVLNITVTYLWLLPIPLPLRCRFRFLLLDFPYMATTVSFCSHSGRSLLLYCGYSHPPISTYIWKASWQTL